MPRLRRCGGRSGCDLKERKQADNADYPRMNPNPEIITHLLSGVSLVVVDRMEIASWRGGDARDFWPDGVASWVDTPVDPETKIIIFVAADGEELPEEYQFRLDALFEGTVRDGNVLLASDLCDCEREIRFLVDGEAASLV